MDAARERLRDFGIALEVERQDRDARVVTLSREGQRQRYLAVATEPMTLGSLAHGTLRQFSTSPEPLLIIGNSIGRRSAAAFRDSGIQFIDTLGNAFIAFGGVFVEVAGRVESTTQISDARERTARRRQPTNIFSSGRSQVILALISWPELSTAKIREIANAAGVSTGLAHNTLDQLQEAGFVVPASRRLDRIEQLLDLWTAAYPTGLGKRLEIANYHGDVSRPISRFTAEQPIYLSSESAKGSGVVRPATLTVYLEDLDPKFLIVNRWDASRDRKPNIFVRHKFWTSPRTEEERPSTSERNAPWPLVYADLVATRDARLSEVAQNWRARCARSDEV
jgi:hypothetical protein